MFGIVHFVPVVTAAGRALVPGVVHVGRVDVVQSLRAVVRLNHLDRRSVFYQYAAQALANLGELFGIGCPKRLGSPYCRLVSMRKPVTPFVAPAEPKPIWARMMVRLARSIGSALDSQDNSNSSRE